MSFRFFPAVQSDLCRLQCADLRIVAIICAVCLLATSALTVVKTHETPLSATHGPRAEEQGNDGFGLVRKIFHMLRTMPPAMCRVCAFQFLAWWSWFHHTLFIAVWVGKVVNRGDGAAHVGSAPYVRYERGLKAASMGFVMFAVLTGVVSLLLPAILHRFKTRRTLATAQVLLMLCYLATFLVPRGHIYLAAANIGKTREQ